MDKLPPPSTQTRHNERVPLRVTISGSYRKHLSHIMSVREELCAAGATVLRPSSTEVLDAEQGFVRLVGDPDSPSGIQAAQLAAIRQSDLVYLVNPGGYCGSSAMLEIGYACGLGIPVAFAEPPFEPAAAGLGSVIGSPRAALAPLAALHLDRADAALLTTPTIHQGSRLERRAEGLGHWHDDTWTLLDPDRCEYCRTAVMAQGGGG